MEFGFPWEMIGPILDGDKEMSCHECVDSVTDYTSTRLDCLFRRFNALLNNHIR